MSMAKRGQKAKPTEVHQLAGTVRKDRVRQPAVESIHGEPVKPDWLSPEAAVIWDTKVEVYKRRGQAMVGLESTLAQYCALEAELIRYYEDDVTPLTAMISQHRVYAGEFFDTPASQLIKPPKGKGNAFDNNGRTKT